MYTQLAQIFPPVLIFLSVIQWVLRMPRERALIRLCFCSCCCCAVSATAAVAAPYRYCTIVMEEETPRQTTTTTTTTFSVLPAAAASPETALVPIVAVPAADPVPSNPYIAVIASAAIASAADATSTEPPLSGVLVPVISAASQESTNRIEPVPVRLTAAYKELESGKRTHHALVSRLDSIITIIQEFTALFISWENLFLIRWESALITGKFENYSSVQLIVS